MARLLATAALAALTISCRPCLAQQGACGFSTLMTAASTFATCCESTKARDCSKGFPTKCTLQCAKLIVPFYSLCAKTIKVMPKDQFKFPLQALTSFVQNCEHTQELFTHSTRAGGQCAVDTGGKEQRILDVTEACCHQDGKFVCESGVSWKCNAECATAYVPFYDQCVKKDSAISVQGLQKYNHLYEECANMGSKEVKVLLTDLDHLVEDRKCLVNTTGITTRGPKVISPRLPRSPRRSVALVCSLALTLSLCWSVCDASLQPEGAYRRMPRQ